MTNALFRDILHEERGRRSGEARGARAGKEGEMPAKKLKEFLDANGAK